MNISQNSCYLSIVRPPLKSTKHCLTGKCEIERVCIQNQHEGLGYSIEHSKVLQKYKVKYPYNNVFVPKQGEQLCFQKNITDQQTKFYVTKVLKELHCYNFSTFLIQKLIKTRYDKKNQKYQMMLIQIWKNFKPNQKLQNRISNQWISLGFQANDPATDFRGSGYLGLINLYRLSECQLGKKLFKVASCNQTQYFFSSAGIFFTMLAKKILLQKHLGYNFWVCASQQQVLTQFQLVYLMLFNEFNKFWLQQCVDKSIMQFNVNLKKFQEIILMNIKESFKMKIQKAIEQ